jgi:hypothetical protein
LGRRRHDCCLGLLGLQRGHLGLHQLKVLLLLRGRRLGIGLSLLLRLLLLRLLLLCLLLLRLSFPPLLLTVMYIACHD